MKNIVPMPRGGNALPKDVEDKLVSISDFLLSMPLKDRNEFLNKYVASTVGEAIGKHYKMLIEMESAEVEAALQTKRSRELTEQVKVAIPNIMKLIGEALQDIDKVYNEVQFDPNSPTKDIWDMVRVIASTRVINVSYSAYDGMGEAFDVALDLIQKMMSVYKQKFLPPESK